VAKAPAADRSGTHLAKKASRFPSGSSRRNSRRRERSLRGSVDGARPLMPCSGRDEATGIVAVPVTHPTIDRRIVLVWCPGETPPAARAFITVAREQLG